MLFSQSIGTIEELLTTEMRERQVSALLDSIARQFPVISYELVRSPALLNAQALMLKGRKVVKLYGGLAFHPRLGLDAIGFALLHETGHHLAHGSRLPWNPFLACECRADEWAMRNRAVARGWHVDFVKAFSDLDALFAEHISPNACEIENKESGCWASDWKTRHRSLVANETLPAGHRCPL
jgi:hypothetical protein